MSDTLSPGRVITVAAWNGLKGSSGFALASGASWACDSSTC